MHWHLNSVSFCMLKLKQNNITGIQNVLLQLQLTNLQELHDAIMSVWPKSHLVESMLRIQLVKMLGS